MKLFTILKLSGLFLLSAIILPTNKIYSQTSTAEIDLNLIKEGDENNKLERQRWIKEMHRCESGVDYQILDAESQKSKQQLRQKRVENILLSGKKEIPQSEVVANGHLKGEWLERGSNNLAGRIHTADIDFNRELIYAASAGGNVWRGTLEGKNWQCLNNGFKIKNLRMIKVIPIAEGNRIIVVGNSPAAVYYSDNEGMTWNTSAGLENPASWGGFQQGVVANDAERTVYVLGSEWDNKKRLSLTSIYRSKDKGENFELVKQITLGLNLCDIWAPQTGSPDVYLLHKDSISKISSNGNIELVSILNINENFNAFDNAYLRGSFPMGEKYFYVSFYLNSERITKFYLTMDEGASWDYMGKVNFNRFDHNSFAVSPSYAERLFYGGVDLHRSWSAGATWDSVNKWSEYYGDPIEKLHADIPGILTFSNLKGNDVILIGTDGGLYISYDDMQTVKNLSLKDLNVSQYYSVYTYRNKPGIIFAGSQDQGFQRCLTDSGGTLGFEQTISGDYGHLSSSDGGDNLWTVYPGFAMLYRNLASGSKSSSRWDFKGSSSDRFWMAPILADPAEPKAAYISCGGIDWGNYIWRLFYTGSGISTQILPFNFNNDSTSTVVSAIGISPIDYRYFYAHTNNGKFYVSTNSGNEWEQAPKTQTPGNSYLYGSCILPSPNTLGKLYIAGSGYSNPGVIVTYDNGQSFTPLDSGLPRTMIYEIASTLDEKYLFAATEIGPYVYIASEGCWFEMGGLNAADQVYWTVEYLSDINTVRFGTYGRGIWDFKITEMTDIAENNNNSIPIPKFNIQAYPNPVINNTVISFEMPCQAIGSLKIWDLNGRIIKEFNNNNFISGENQYEWDGKDNSGFKLPSGNYLCVVSAMGASAYVKISLVK